MKFQVFESLLTGD